VKETSIRPFPDSERLITSKAQLNIVQTQVNEAFALRKIERSIKASVTVITYQVGTRGRKAALLALR
jgi:hypothetical protein